MILLVIKDYYWNDTISNKMILLVIKDYRNDTISNKTLLCMDPRRKLFA
jgi:hypothetical protein